MPRSVRSAAYAALGCALAVPLLVLVAYYVVPFRVWDAHVVDWFSSFEYTSPTSYVYTTVGHIAKAITFFAEPVPMLAIVALGCAYAVSRKRPADAVAALAVVGGANLTTQVLKHLLAHDRFEPFLDHAPDPTTFPSGHITSATAMVVALVWVTAPRHRRAVAAAGAAYVLLVGISVLILDWHFPSDILGALAVTGAWAFGVLAVYLYMGSGGRRLGRGARSRPVADELDDLGHDLVDVEVLRRVDAGDSGRP